ncbi:MAG: protein jag [Lachnospiraceae bacterium]|nr:protein jag [Lachnospiraceae bacterium]
MNEYKEFSGKTVEEAIELAGQEFSCDSDRIEYEIIEKESSGFLGLRSKPARINARLKEVSPEETACDFVSKILECMSIEAGVTAELSEDGSELSVQIDGEDMAVLIGKRGQTLDCFQYLVSLVVNKTAGSYIKVKLDTENYRARRKDTLENLAKNIAVRVKKSHKPVSLEPMNPYERRVIHSALQNDKYVETHSEGEEPFRKVVVTPKKGVVYENKKNNRFGGNRRGGYDRKRPISSKEFHKKYGADTKDYSTDYKKDYAAYLESKAAAKAASQEGEGGTDQ